MLFERQLSIWFYKTNALYKKILLIKSIWKLFSPTQTLYKICFHLALMICCRYLIVSTTQWPFFHSQHSKPPTCDPYRLEFIEPGFDDKPKVRLVPCVWTLANSCFHIAQEETLLHISPSHDRIVSVLFLYHQFLSSINSRSLAISLLFIVFRYKSTDYNIFIWS